MMDFATFKSYISARIDSVTSLNVYSTKLPQNKSGIYPCLVITFTNNNNPYLNKEIWIIEIDYWHVVNSDSVDSTSVLSAVEAVKGTLNGGWQTEAEGFYKTYLDQSFEIPDPQPGAYHFYQKYSCELR